jgi:hypothetical protein
MPRSILLCPSLARLRGLASAVFMLALLGCNDTESFTALDEGSLPVMEAVDEPAFATRFAGGIPFGTFRLPTDEFGSRFNGAHRIIYPKHLLNQLRSIKARGGKVAIRLSYGDRYIKDAAGNFSLTKWKAMVDRYRNVNFSSYIKDGTIIGHYLIDEPQDYRNWNGKRIPQSTIEEMARFSKQRWPGMATIVRTWPDYLDDYKGSYRYLDAAWAQYAANRWSNPTKFLNENVEKARRKGLALVVGLNIIKGSPSKGKMSASQVKTYGSALLSSSYPCAFISWQYRDSYMTSSIKDAMSYLRRKAQNRATKTCKAP